MLLKTLLCVVEEKAAETAGRTSIKDEDWTVKSITEVRTRIDADKGRKVQDTL
jgi:membrane protein implicated in regulation of membrane protease activity